MARSRCEGRASIRVAGLSTGRALTRPFAGWLCSAEGMRSTAWVGVLQVERATCNTTCNKRDPLKPASLLGLLFLLQVLQVINIGRASKNSGAVVSAPPTLSLVVIPHREDFYL